MDGVRVDAVLHERDVELARDVVARRDLVGARPVRPQTPRSHPRVCVVRAAQ